MSFSITNAAEFVMVFRDINYNENWSKINKELSREHPDTESMRNAIN